MTLESLPNTLVTTRKATPKVAFLAPDPWPGTRKGGIYIVTPSTGR
jgi:hypothetical protein